jgi:hypothetical protein
MRINKYRIYHLFATQIRIAESVETKSETNRPWRNQIIRIHKYPKEE